MLSQVYYAAVSAVLLASACSATDSTDDAERLKTACLSEYAAIAKAQEIARTTIKLNENAARAAQEDKERMAFPLADFVLVQLGDFKYTGSDSKVVDIACRLGNYFAFPRGAFVESALSDITSLSLYDGGRRYDFTLSVDASELKYLAHERKRYPVVKSVTCTPKEVLPPIHPKM